MTFDDDRPARKLKHEIGQDLSQLSVDELDDRILLLQDEIVRLQQERAGKSAARSGADALFKL